MEHRTVIALLRHFKSPLIALLALTLSASLVAASQPASPGATGRANASSHAGKTVPDQAGDESNDTNESSDTGDSSGSGDSPDSANHCNVDLTGDLSSFSHGEIVCTAAHMTTPSGYANHGAWVSHWAKMQGAGASATGKSHKPSH